MYIKRWIAAMSEPPTQALIISNLYWSKSLGGGGGGGGEGDLSMPPTVYQCCLLSDLLKIPFPLAIFTIYLFTHKYRMTEQAY